MKITVLAVQIAHFWVVSDKIGHEVTIYGRAGSRNMEEFLRSRTNGLVTYGDSVKLSTDLSVLEQSQCIVVSIPPKACGNW